MADWERLARYVMDGRAAKGWSQEDLARAAAGMKQTTVSAVETAKGTSRPVTLAAIGHALGWRPGSADRILAGGEPELINPEPEPGTVEADEEARERMRRRADLAAARDTLDTMIAELDGELDSRNGEVDSRDTRRAE